VRHDPLCQALDGRSSCLLHSWLQYLVWEPGLPLHRGSNIWFGSLDFLYLVLLPPFMPVDHASLLGFNGHVGDIDTTGVEGSVPRHPLLSHLTHLPTSTLSLSQWLVFAYMPTRHGLLRAFSPMVSTTRG
jgi:hypothetical protein